MICNWNNYNYHYMTSTVRTVGMMYQEKGGKGRKREVFRSGFYHGVFLGRRIYHGAGFVRFFCCRLRLRPHLHLRLRLRLCLCLCPSPFSLLPSICRLILDSPSAAHDLTIIIHEVPLSQYRTGTEYIHRHMSAGTLNPRLAALRSLRWVPLPPR